MQVDPWMWIAFIAFILSMLALDLFVLHREAHEVSFAEAGIWSAVWISLGLAFGALIWAWQGPQTAGEYYAGYLIEKSLSVDNVFVFALIFTYFAVPKAYQHRVLFWGVLGALVFRAIFIVAGAALLHEFHWMIYVFGGFLVLTGIKMWRSRDTHMDPGANPVLRAMRQVVRITPDYVGQRMAFREDGRWFATPLLAVLVVIETSDIIFAVDSIPAIFAVTDEPFIVFTSNAFAILGLRALYFLLAGMMDRFTYLKVGLAAVLVFVGAKMLLTDIWKVPIWLSLLVIAALIGGSILISLRREAAEAPEVPGVVPEPSPRESIDR